MKRTEMLFIIIVGVAFVEICKWMTNLSGWYYVFAFVALSVGFGFVIHHLERKDEQDADRNVLAERRQTP